MAVSDDIIAWSVKKLGVVIGDGECWTMVETALSESGGKTSTQIKGGPVGDDENYVWGVLVKDLQRGVVAGDILQFRNYVWENNTQTRVTHPNGDWETEGTTKESRPHHTAIVEKVVEPGLVDILEQNSPKGDPVRRYRLRITSFLGPKTKKTLPNGDVVETTPNHRVTGAVWAYHPMAALPGKKP
ncbi:MAG: hypothetical protein BGP06_19200 [Rhizobiales bacterium 65-9]|nr:MAG: hypothetical protein BGP06_19200 [Rhizobiales bacterium 65-9]